MLITLAILPAIIGLVIVYMLDRHREPPLYVAGLFILGALVVLPAGLFERTLLDAYSAAPDMPTGYLATLLTAFFVAGAVEETCKGVVFWRFVYHKPVFDEPYDGVVYAVAIGLGFAAVENVLYVTSSGITTAFVRAFTAVPGHALFGVVMGSAFARAKFYGGSYRKAFWLPAILHGTYDAFALAQGFVSNMLLIAYLMWLVRFAYYQALPLHGRQSQGSPLAH
ncbi:MAG: PrsW family glutamic-type intramembrane protease [Firmicutes bacterium]|nr:PrsW family glutamic-type intramembrane protease [Bacillota bacterium]